MSESCPTEIIAFAEKLADASGEVIRHHFRTRVPVDIKPDASPVTVADRDAEAAIRALIDAEFPDHGIIGEEHGNRNADAEYVWVLDPIDGTRAFITGKPIFGTLIALVAAGRPILGCIDQPINRERWVGAAGHATVFNGETVTTRACPALDRATLNTTSPDLFEGGDAEAFAAVAARSGFVNYGGDCYAYGLVASGFIDLVIESGLSSYDYCALAPVVEGAGGVMTDWAGDPLTTASDGRVIASGDGKLHAETLNVLAKARSN